MRRAILVLVFMATATFADRARAGDPAVAQALFDEGKRLAGQRDYAGACVKFEESQREDPGMGTLFHLADCEEQLGKTASAWAAFLEVASEARAQGEGTRAAAASERAAALESRLARITVDPGADKDTPGLQLLRDGVPMGRAQWAVSLPVDPGAHVIEARAPGKGAWSATVRAFEGARAAVTVPLLADLPPTPSLPTEAPAPVPPPPASVTNITSADMTSAPPGHAQRVAGVLIGAAGVAGLGVGAYFGVVSLERHHDADPHCTGNVCDATGVSLRDDARQAGNVSTVALALGGAAVLGGLITYAIAPRASETTVALGPGGLAVTGRW